MHMVQKMTKQSKVRSLLEQKNLTEDQLAFLLAVYKTIRRKSNPVLHHMFCDEIAMSMSNSDQKFDKGDVCEMVGELQEKPHKFVATNGRTDCAGFRATDYFVDWLKENGVM